MNRSSLSRIAYAVSAAATVVGAVTGLENLQRFAKPLMVPALALGVQKPSPVLFVALAAATVGDVLLIDPDDDSRILRGASAFGVMQGCYIVLLAERGARPTVVGAIPRLGGWALASGQLARRSPTVAPGLAAYGLTLATMSTLAAHPSLAPGATVRAGLVVPSSDPRSWLASGGVLFTVSDALIVFRRLYVRTESRRRVAEGLVLGTYALAQLLLVEGFSRKQ